MSPNDYRRARSEASSASSSSSPYLCSFVDSRPYLPNLRVDLASSSVEASVARAAVGVLEAHRRGPPNGSSGSGVSDSGRNDDCSAEELKKLKVSVVSGGITNSLFRVERLGEFLGDEDIEHDSVLVRVFGAEGMIDRDVETSTYASLCDRSSAIGVAIQYLGRFSNGRVEGWLGGYRTCSKEGVARPDLSDAVARRMAQLHANYDVPEHLREHHSPDEPAMWTQLRSWMDQALGYRGKFRTPDDEARAAALDLPSVSDELDRLERDVVPRDARVAFCHNDLLSANIMVHVDTGDVQLIDFEYGGVNYRSFDVANHFNEFAGGTDDSENGVCDYGLFPSPERQEEFVRAYVRAARDGREAEGDDEEEEVQSMLSEVRAFILPNHLYWGLWAVNQAAMEGCEGFDYLTYAKSRIDRYHKVKGEVEREIGAAKN